MPRMETDTDNNPTTDQDANQIQQATSDCQLTDAEDDDDDQMDRRMSEQSMLVLYNMQKDGQLCDATLLTTDGGRFPVHRNIMSVCSPYFRALFTNRLACHLPLPVSGIIRPSLSGGPAKFSEPRLTDPTEAPPCVFSADHVGKETEMAGGMQNAITIPGVSAENLQLIIQFAYTRHASITLDNATDLMVDASQFNIIKLMTKCQRFVLANLDVTNCFSMRRFAHDFQFADLESKIRRYVARNFPTITQGSSELMELSIDEIADLLGADDLNARDEQLVWETALRWIDADPENRRQHVYLLMTKTRLGLLGTHYFVERVKCHPYVISCDESNKACKQLIIEALKFLYELDTVFVTDNEEEVATPKLGYPRLPHDLLFAVGGWSGGSPTNYIEVYDVRADRWSSVEEVDPSGPRAYHGVVVIGFDIYVIGGFDGMDYFNSCRCFNVHNRKWSEIAPMHCNRCYVSVTKYRDVIYAMGGYDGRTRQSTAEKYNYKKNQWEKISPMNMRRSDSSASELDGHIYMVGGFDGQECMRSAEVYDPELNMWSLITPMHSQRSGVSSIAYNGLIYAVGGFNGTVRLRSAERFDPKQSQWTIIPDMFNCRSNFAIEVIDEFLYAVGGFNGSTTIFSVECYDHKNNVWHEAMDMSLFRSALSACVISDLPNAEDYIRKSREELVEDRRHHFLVARRGCRQRQAFIVAIDQ